MTRYVSDLCNPHALDGCSYGMSEQQALALLPEVQKDLPEAQVMPYESLGRTPIRWGIFHRRQGFLLFDKQLIAGAAS